jgi:hypothetical protein
LEVERVQLRFPHAIQHEHQGEKQLCHVIGVNNGLTACLFLDSHLFVDNVQPLQDLLVAQGEQGQVLNGGGVTEAEQTGLQALYEHPWAEIELLTKNLEYNAALDGQHAVAVLVAVHGVLVALLRHRQREQK